ncbi:unnamed protein product [Mytilus coruscus]|uniref:Novel STAND NTPase 3 domain-containing protein n=1 Tax=Mytilus coruscus TaxID=42192 RepID=A0A6J8D056_MYTCO|nr:unnamed protein product [Mytilus coruscus]
MRLFVCTNRDYKLVKFSSLTEWKNNVSIHDKLVILFEDIFGKTNSRFSEDQDSVLLEELYASANHMKINRIIITVRDTVRQSCHTVLEKHRILNEKFILDISSKELQMNETQKFTCLLNYFKITNIEITRNATDENFKEEKVQDNMFKVKFHDETVQKMIKTKTTIGFPQAVYLFTGNRKFTGQGPAFFADAPNCLLNEIKELREKGKKVEQDRWQYVTLVYTMLIGCELRPNGIDNHLVEEIFKSLYKRNLPENFNELIRASATVMSGRYSSCKSGENHSTFTFQHQTTFEAVLVSYGEKEPAVVIPFMSLEFITELVRPFHY